MIKDKDRTPVAQDVIAMCTKCKMELNHVVIAQNIEGIVERVKCHTCGSEHKYRSSKKTSTVKTTKKATSTKKNLSEKNFEKLSEKFMDKNPVPYNMSGMYNIDDVIQHGVFGKGIVVNIFFQKMEVIFADGPRILAMDRK
jgi:hypothetical protein